MKTKIANHCPRIKNSLKGFSLLELVFAIAIFMIIVSGVVIPIINNYINNLENQEYVKANAVINESWEAVRSIRNGGWSNMISGTHGLALSGGNWIFSGSSDLTDGFTREVILSEPSRDIADNLVTEGGTPDPDSMSVHIIISWKPTPYTERSIETESLLTNYRQ